MARGHSRAFAPAPVDRGIGLTYYYDIIFVEAKVAEDKTTALTATSERPANAISGYVMLILLFLAILAEIYGVRALGMFGNSLGPIIVPIATLAIILVLP